MHYAYIYFEGRVIASFDDLNIACINSIGGMIVMGNRSKITRLTDVVLAALMGAQHLVRRFGTLLREAAVIAFAIRCKVIDGR